MSGLKMKKLFKILISLAGIYFILNGLHEGLNGIIKGRTLWQNTFFNHPESLQIDGLFNASYLLLHGLRVAFYQITLGIVVVVLSKYYQQVKNAIFN
jgi:hypothetical protein